MTEIATNDGERDVKGRFVIGTKPGPGRPKGARSKFTEAFLEDLLESWNELGIDALRRCAKEEPAQFCRIAASLMPKDLNVNAVIATMSAQTTLEQFRAAVAMLGNAEPKRLPVFDADQ